MWEFPIRKVASGGVLLEEEGKGGKEKYLMESFRE